MSLSYCFVMTVTFVWLVMVLKRFVFKNTFFISLRVDKLMKCSRFKGLQHHSVFFFLFFFSKVATQLW